MDARDGLQRHGLVSGPSRRAVQYRAVAGLRKLGRILLYDPDDAYLVGPDSSVPVLVTPCGTLMLLKEARRIKRPMFVVAMLAMVLVGQKFGKWRKYERQLTPSSLYEVPGIVNHSLQTVSTHFCAFPYSRSLTSFGRLFAWVSRVALLGGGLLHVTQPDLRRPSFVWRRSRVGFGSYRCGAAVLPFSPPPSFVFPAPPRRRKSTLILGGGSPFPYPPPFCVSGRLSVGWRGGPLCSTAAP